MDKNFIENLINEVKSVEEKCFKHSSNRLLWIAAQELWNVVFILKEVAIQNEIKGIKIFD